MKLQKKVQKDWASVQKRAGSMFNVYANDIGKMIELAGKDILASIASVLSIHPEVSYKTLKQGQTLDRLSTVIHRRCELLALDVESYWGDKRRDFDLLARLSMNFITLKTSPPWIKKKLDLQTEPKDGRYDPRKGHLRFYFFNMADAIIKQVSQGALQEETLNQILTRVRAMFNRRHSLGVREGSFDPYGLKHNVNLSPTGEYEETLKGAVDISEGTYTLEDVAYFQDSQKRAMQWESRDYRPWFSDELKRNNRYLRDLEQVLMSDAIDTMHSGQLQAGMGYPDEMGIQDFQWVVSRPQPTCDECTKRDELTMKEIKVQIKDEWGTQPPPLHPNCLLGHTVVSAAGISKHFKRWFDGKIVVVSVPGHDDLSITMNHPVLTDRGWVPAGELKKSDKLVRSIDDRTVVSILKPDDYKVKTAIDNLSDSVQMSNHMSRMTMPISSEHFHGDGIVNTKVDIVFINRFLPHNFKSNISKMLDKFSFGFGKLRRAGLNSFGSFFKSFISFLRSANSGLSGQGVFLSFLGTGHFHSLKHSIAAASNLQTQPGESASHGGARDSDLPSNIHARLSGHIEFVEISDLRITDFSGHVYNLETDDGYYIANGLIVHNCRCQLVPKISDEWSKKVLKDAGQEWDPETGIVYRADKQERDAGFTDMTLDEYLASVPTGVS